MKNTTCLLALLFSFQICAISQINNHNGVFFSSQAQIDDFQTMYPGCCEIEGDVWIEGNDITNLRELSILTTIAGDLCLHKNKSLSSLAGLENLAHVECLTIKNNDALVNLAGLESLDTIKGTFKIWYNDLLQNLSGLDNLSYIKSDLLIEGNHALLNCHGLENLNSVGGSLVIGCVAGWMHHNRSLNSLSGLENLRNVNEYLWINCNDSLTNLIGLGSLENIGVGLIINGNKCLKTLIGLEQLKSCGTCLIIGGWGDCDGNHALVNLKGIENINPGTISNLRIRNNHSLASCNIKGVCNYIVNPNSFVEISDNAPGCNNIHEVENACKEPSVEERPLFNSFSINPNPFTRYTSIKFETSEPILIEILMINHLGIEVENIPVNHKTNGLQEIYWDSNKLASGVYHCVLKTNNGVLTKKMIKLN